MKKNVLFLILMFLCSTCAVNAAPQPFGQPTMASAVKAFNDRKFGEALSQFETLDQHGQCNENTHYYMGRCCQQLSQVARAKDNYSWVVHYGKDARLKYYAQVAYMQLNKYSHNRTYEGNGNNFVGFRAGRTYAASSGGGGGGGG